MQTITDFNNEILAFFFVELKFKTQDKASYIYVPTIFLVKKLYISCCLFSLLSMCLNTFASL